MIIGESEAEKLRKIVKDPKGRCTYLKQRKDNASIRMITDQTGKCIYGMQYDKVAGGYHVEAYCTRNIAGAVICAHNEQRRMKPIASITYTKKEQKHTIGKKALQSVWCTAIFSKLIDEKKAKEQNLEEYVKRTAEFVRLDPVTIFRYLQVSGIKIRGLSSLHNRMKAEKKNMIGIYKR